MPAIVLISVDLPAPLSPTRAVTLPAGDVQVDPAERLDGAEALGDAPQPEQRDITFVFAQEMPAAVQADL